LHCQPKSQTRNYVSLKKSHIVQSHITKTGACINQQAIVS
jgi:hypothetical protein